MGIFKRLFGGFGSKKKVRLATFREIGGYDNILDMI